MERSRQQRNPIRDQRTVLKFIKHMEKHTCLWDAAHLDYRITSARKDAWLAIASHMREPVHVLMRKWRSLCTTYFKNQDDMNKRLAKNPATRYARPSWYAYNAMHFLGKARAERRKRGKPKYLIVDDEHKNGGIEANLHDMFDREDDVIEDHDDYEMELDEGLSEIQSESIIPYGLAHKLEQHAQEEYSVEVQQCDITVGTTNYSTKDGQLRAKTDKHIHDSKSDTHTIDEQVTEYNREIGEITFERQYLNEKRKSDLLFELNEKLEQDLQRQKAENQLQKINIEVLEKKLRQFKQKQPRSIKSSLLQEDVSEFQSNVIGNLKHESTTLDDSEKLIDAATVTVQGLPMHSSEEQYDPLSHQTSGILKLEGNLNTFQNMTSALNRLQSTVEKIANKNNCRYSGFGDFIVQELNELNETVSTRLIQEFTVMLLKEQKNQSN